MKNIRLLLILFSGFVQGCNHQLPKIENRINQISIPNYTLIDSTKPKRIRLLFYPTDTTNVWDYYLYYNSTDGKLEKITLGANYVYRTFTYSGNQIKLQENNTDPPWIVIMKNEKVDSIKLEYSNNNSFPRQFIFDDSSDLIKVRAKYDSVVYKYLNGNMIEQQNYNNVFPYHNSIRYLTYYDSILITSNSRYFPLAEWDEVLPFVTYDAIDYLNIFGKSNRNLLKMRVGYFPDYGTIDTMYFKWKIQKSRIVELDMLRSDSSLWHKVYYEY